MRGVVPANRGGRPLDMPKPLFIALLLGVAPSLAIHAQPSRPVVAVLEDSHDCDGESTTRAAHPLFGLAAGGWVALNSAEAARPFDLRDVTWTVAFDGRNLGPVRTIDPGFSTEYAWTYPRDRRLTVRPVPRAPVVPRVKGSFGGWCGSATSRPLVLVSAPNFEDPDRWKPFRPTSAMRDSLFADFRKVVGKVSHCPGNSERGVPFDYSRANVVLVKGYQDRAGRRLVALELKDEKKNWCDGPPDDADGPQWFLLSDSVHALGPNFELVDAGDYDRDGKSDLLFWYSGYNNDGFTLFYDGLARHVDFRWNYH
jgi:hypothetical protein